jgi:hypothetical protein
MIFAAALHFVSQAQQAGQAVFITSWVELVGLAVIVTAFATAYKHIECHQNGCHRLGRFQHGHLKLCGVHHPLVPDDGKIRAEQIDAVSKAKDHPATKAKDH